MGAFSRFLRPKIKLFAVKFSHILEVFDEVYEENPRHIFTIYASKNEVVCCEVQMHFGNSLPARFTEKVVGALSRFMRPKMELFASESHF